MLKDFVTIDDVVELLNDAVDKDPEAIYKLAVNRVPCNAMLADHPTIQVGKFGDEYKVGLIGILNGIFGIADDGFGAIAGDFEVVCPNGHDTPEKTKIGEQCLECGDHVVSKLTGFKRIR